MRVPPTPPSNSFRKGKYNEFNIEPERFAPGLVLVRIEDEVSTIASFIVPDKVYKSETLLLIVLNEVFKTLGRGKAKWKK